MTISGLGVSANQPIEDPAEGDSSGGEAVAPCVEQTEAVTRGSAPRNLFATLTSPDAEVGAGGAVDRVAGSGVNAVAVGTVAETVDVVGRAKVLAAASDGGKFDLEGLRALVKEAAADGALEAGDLEGLAKLYFGDVGDDPALRGLITEDAHEYLGELVPFGSTESVLTSHLDQFEAVRSAPSRLGTLVQDRPGSDLLSILGGDRSSVSAVETRGDDVVARDAPPIAQVEVQHDADGYYVFVDVVGLKPSTYPVDDLRAALRELGGGDPDLQDVRFVVDAREPVTDAECAYFYGPEP